MSYLKKETMEDKKNLYSTSLFVSYLYRSIKFIWVKIWLEIVFYVLREYTFLFTVLSNNNNNSNLYKHLVRKKNNCNNN